MKSLCLKSISLKNPKPLKKPNRWEARRSLLVESLTSSVYLILISSTSSKSMDMDRTIEDCEEDLDFVESDHDFESDDDDIQYDRNITNVAEIGSGGHDNEVQEEREKGNENELDELDLPFSEDLFSQCSSDEDDSYHFPQFTFDQDMINP